MKVKYTINLVIPACYLEKIIHDEVKIHFTVDLNFKLYTYLLAQWI